MYCCRASEQLVMHEDFEGTSHRCNVPSILCLKSGSIFAQFATDEVVYQVLAPGAGARQHGEMAERATLSH